MKNKGSSHAGEPGRAPAGHEPCLHPKHILVVDDDCFIRDLNAETLTGFGYLVDTAEDGAAAWEALSSKSYDLLITDNNMPKVSGIELIKKLHSAQITLPVILASGTSHAEESEMRLAATLPKPFTLDELLETVRRVLGDSDSVTRQLEFLQILSRNSKGL